MRLQQAFLRIAKLFLARQAAFQLIERQDGVAPGPIAIGGRRFVPDLPQGSARILGKQGAEIVVAGKFVQQLLRHRMR